MTGGSLGLRAGSYGSLQQYQQQQQQQPETTTPVQPARKPPKMLLPGAAARDKDRRLSWAFKAAGRRRVGMLLLVVASAAVLLSFTSIVGKDEDVSASPQTNFDSLNRSSRTSLRYLWPPPIPVKDHEDITDSISKHLSAISLNETHPPLQILPPSVLYPRQHPCEGFSFPPPPADKKRIGPRPCPVCYITVEHAMALMPASPSISPVLKHLDYVSEESSVSIESSEGSEFGGHPSIQQRNESFDVKESMSVHCGFVKGQKPGRGTGFDISDVDLLEMEQCGGIVVASAIFGNYDIMQQPKNISEAAKRTVCFYMFADEETEAYIKNTSTIDSTNRVGLWRVVVVRNLPYVDARRNGKVPKLLLHRLFPNARFSLWIDGKLELVVDPYQILERFLWRENATFAISRHYRRFDVFDEAEANKAAGKYDNASIDYQIEFYKREGLTRYTRAKLPITSDVPEGCVIIKEHTPITNLFTCLWFNEVDRFTSRDQISFSTVRDKLISRVNWSPYMFLDCERRNFVIQAYHRDLLEQRSSRASVTYPPPSIVVSDRSPRKSIHEISYGTSRDPPLGKQPIRRGKDRKSGSKRHRPRTSNGRDIITI